MAEIIVDARGLSCPEPVIQTKRALTAHDSFTVIVDNETAKENILRFCSNAQAHTHVSPSQDEWHISVSK